ncbi:hypothetical protein I3842_15G014300 [Carya illinoinensis]|uniref:Cellulose synthase n=1 Tax=Carya illinoinensis TaxID=32201 RepID=A0A922A9D8_CARIL|nr:hypothetical protein I3842_15G014300 [Carya illinoinensis]
MDTKGRLVAGSYNRNEFVLINADEVARVTSTKELSRQICQICGDEIEITVDGEPFVACNECAFPVCRTCYEYERGEGNQVCPHCKMRYKRIKGSARVEGDEEEDDTDDLENEFDIGGNAHQIAVSMHSTHLNVGRGSQVNGSAIATLLEQDSASVSPDISLQTHREKDAGISSDKHTLIIPPYMSRAKRVHPMLVSESASFQPRPMDPNKDLAVYGYGTVAWKERMEEWKKKQDEKLHVVKRQGGGGGGNNAGEVLDDPDLPMMDEGRQPLSRKLSIPSSKINPYRMIILLRIVILGFFFQYRITHPVNDAYGLWLTSVICEIWFAVSWILDQFPKWSPIMRETYLDRLSLRYEKEGKPSELANIDIFVGTVDPMKEPPLITANTVLSILAVDYPVDKITCYVSDDGAAMLTFEALSETSEFARKWVPFCKRFNIEPRAPEWYFYQKVDYLKDKLNPTFIRERRAMKREYEEFKVRINGLVTVAQKVPEEGWTMQDGTPWPGNNVRDHPGMIQVFLGQNGVLDIEGNELPRLIYVSREKRPGFDHHKKAGAMNALIDMKGLDGIQGPIYVGTGCVFNRLALYGYDAPMKKKPPGKTCNCWPKSCCFCHGSRKKNKKKKSDDKKQLKNREASSQMHALENIEKGIEASTLMEDREVPNGASSASLLKEAIHVISCSYEDKTEWGKEVGWIYGSVTEDVLTGFKMHCHGWRSVYCMPKRPAFKGSAPINLSDRLHQVLGWALGSVEIFFSRHCPIWYGYGCGLKGLERFSYINLVVYPLTSIPLLAYCTLPAICLFTGKFIIPEISNYASLVFMALFVSIAATGILEMQWGGVSIHDWWRNEQFWVIGSVSSHLFALFQGLLKVLAGVNTNHTVTSKAADDGEFFELYLFKWTSLLIPPMSLLIINIIGVVVGVSDVINNGYDSWGPLFGKLFFALWVIIHLYPFLKGLMGKQDRVPTIVVVWAILLASIFSLLWVRINPFLSKGDIVLEVCGLDCD